MKTAKFKYKDLGEKVVLKKDLLSFNGDKVLKKAGSTGTIESIQSFYNVASVKIGNRNYKISQNDLELLENNETVINESGLIGTIEKSKEGYKINVTCQGWGNESLHYVLTKLNLIEKLESLPENSKMIFNN